jgi:hypothetical protein
MIKLTDILNENYYAPLYHATTFPRFLSIIKDKKIKPNEQGYVFLTRDKNYKVGGDYATSIVLKIDQEKIRQRYKIYPRVGDITNKNQRIEAEEVIKGEIPLEWVQEIQIPKEIINRIEDAIQTAKEGIEWAKQKYQDSKDPRYINGIKEKIKDIETYSKILQYPDLKII